MEKRVVRKDLISAGIFIVIAGLLYLMESVISRSIGGDSFFVGILLALIPAIIWIAFYYQKDVLEPEPKILVFKMFLLSLLITYGILNPILENVFMVKEWIGSANVLMKILGSILIMGVLQEFTKYLLIRFSIFNLPEFNEKVDGIIYGTVVGIGMATALNIIFVQETQGISLFSGFIYMTIKVLGHGGLGGLIGYIISREKFDNWNAVKIITGLLLVSIIDGLFFYFTSMITSLGFAAGSISRVLFLNLLLASLFAVGLTALVNYFIKKNVGIFEEIDNSKGIFKVVSILLVFAVLFFSGIQYSSIFLNRWQQVTFQDISLNLPQSWMLSKQDSNLLVSAFDPYSINSRLNIIINNTDFRHLNKFVETRVAARENLIKSYTLVNKKAVNKFGQEGYLLEGGYLKEAAGQLYFILNKEYIFKYGNQVLVISLTVDNDEYQENLEKYQKILESLERSEG